MMNRAKSTAAGILLAASMAAVGSAQAMTVFDPSNFAQNIMQVQQMIQQMKKLNNQLAEAQKQSREAVAQTAAMTGTRGMERIVTEATRNNPELNKLSSEIAKQAQLLSKQDLGSINSAYGDMVDKRGKNADAGMAASAQVFANANERFTNLQRLVNSIGTATDDKAIQDLQARIQAEQVMLQNEAIRAQAMNGLLMQQKEQELQLQRRKVLSERFTL
ncbi:type IV secretion system protein VirB5 [Stenotrophomonas sp. PvP086]|nr:hypothetical protein CEE58_01765 [Stenotrophomonas maltophilia]